MSSNPAITIGVDAVDHSSSVLDQVDAKVKKTSDDIIASGEQITSKWQNVKDNFKSHTNDIIASAGGLTSGIAGLSGTMIGLEKSGLAADRANLQLQKSQDALAKLQGSGKATAEQLRIAQEQVTLAQDKATIANESYHDSYNSFLLNIPSQFSSFVTGATGLMSLLGVEFSASSIRSAIFGTTTVASLGAVNVATAESTGLLGMFREASIMAFLENPATIAIIGISALAIALATNVGGIDDKIRALGKTIYDFLEKYFKPLGDAMAWVNDNVLKPASKLFGGDVAQGTDKAKQSTLDFSTQMQSSGVDTVTAMTQTQQSVDLTNTSVANLAQATTDSTAQMNDAYNATTALVIGNTQKMSNAVQNLIALFNALSAAMSRVGAGGAAGKAAQAQVSSIQSQIGGAMAGLQGMSIGGDGQVSTLHSIDNAHFNAGGAIVGGSGLGHTPHNAHQTTTHVVHVHNHISIDSQQLATALQPHLANHHAGSFRKHKQFIAGVAGRVQ